MPDAEAPEFNPERPLPSAFAVIRAVLFSPRNFLVGAAAGIYLLSIKTFVGKVSSFREVYRMAAYASGALIPAIPLVGAFAITYALTVLMGIGIRFVFRTSFLTAVVASVAGFVPIAVPLLRVTTAGLASW